MNILLLNSINIGKLFIVLGIVAGISIIFTILMVLVSKLCATPVDEKVEKVKEKLANANCGGCGYAGCADFAKALVEGKTDITKCNPTPNSNKEEIAKIIGVEFSASVEKYAVVHCAGGINSINKYQYVGNKDCAIISTVQGGKKICPTGCLGEGNCVKKCQYNSIKIIDGVASINKALCEACGVCVNACPKHLIDLIPKSSLVYVACLSTCKGKEVMDACKKGCIGCGICAKFCPNGAIEMIDNHPVIDYTKCNGCKTCVAKCPRKCIKEI